MACETWQGKLDAYLDGQLTAAEAAALGAHLRACPACTGDVLERVQLKRAVAAAGRRYTPSAELRAKITKIAGSKQRKMSLYWILAVPALLIVILSVGVDLYINRETARREQVYSELADQHVATLASATPVDVLSTDRHTVKPWFEGKIPFSFNLPELQGSQYTLLGGKLAYLAQSAGAHLIYQLRKHEISVFIFQDRGPEVSTLPTGKTHALSFNEESWTQNGLRYVVIGDVSADDIAGLSNLLRDAK